MTGLIAYRVFLSLFPLLLLLTTVLGYLLVDHPDLERSVLDSTLTSSGDRRGDPRPPAAGERAGARGWPSSARSARGSPSSSPWGEAFDRIWAVPKKARGGFVSSRLRALLLLLAIGTLSLASTVAAGLVGGSSSALGAVAGVTISIALNLLVFGVAFRLLTTSSVPTRSLLPGVLTAALGVRRCSSSAGST